MSDVHVQEASCQIPLTSPSAVQLGRRAEWAAEGLRREFIDLADYLALTDLATQLAVERTRRWWMPRPDQPWRYD